MRPSRRPHRFLTLALLFAVLAPGTAMGQAKTGTTFGSFLLIEPSARITAMGNAGVSLYQGLQSVYYNPAALGIVDRYGAEFSHSSWLADISFDYVAVGIPVRGVGTFSAAATILNSGDIDVRTVAQPLGTGERYTVSDFALAIGYGRQFTDRFAAGLQASFLQETIWNSSASAFSVNIGTLYRISPDGLHIGASISNLGSKARFSGRDLRVQFDEDPDRFGDNGALPAEQFTDEYPLPILFRVGVSQPFRLGRDAEARVALDAFHPNDNQESVSAGGELTYKHRIALRAGYQNLFLDDSEVGLTLGAGVNLAVSNTVFRLDYAWAEHGLLESTQKVTLDLEF